MAAEKRRVTADLADAQRKLSAAQAEETAACARLLTMRREADAAESARDRARSSEASSLQAWGPLFPFP